MPLGRSFHQEGVRLSSPAGEPLLLPPGDLTPSHHTGLVGDSVFPGQSTAGVTLGTMRVSAEVLQAAGYP